MVLAWCGPEVPLNTLMCAWVLVYQPVTIQCTALYGTGTLYSAVHTVLQCLVYCSTQHTEFLRSVLQRQALQGSMVQHAVQYVHSLLHCIVYNSTTCCVVHSVLQYTVYFTGAQSTTVHCALQCTEYYSARCTAVHRVLQCTVHCSVQSNAVHRALQCTEYCSAPCSVGVYILCSLLCSVVLCYNRA